MLYSRSQDRSTRTQRLFQPTLRQKEAEPEKIFTDEYFVNKAKGNGRPRRKKIITLKDMAGLVNPPLRAASIIGKLKAAVKVPVDFHTHCTPGYGLASSVMAIINGVDILDTNIWWFGGGSARTRNRTRLPLLPKKLGVEIEADMKAVGEIRRQLRSARESLKAFDLGKMPREFDPLTDKLPAEIEAQLDRAVAAAKASDEETLLDACHRIEEYFRIPQAQRNRQERRSTRGMYSNMVAQLKALQAEDLLEDAMKLIPMVRRDAGLVPLVTPTSQIVGSQAVSVALDRKKGNPDYSNPSNQFISLVKGEYGHTRSYRTRFPRKNHRKPCREALRCEQLQTSENPVLPEYGNVKLAANREEELLLELLPTVANTFLRKRRAEEFPQPHRPPRPKPKLPPKQLLPTTSRSQARHCVLPWADVSSP